MSKLDELKEKFEGFVDDLKSKLPSRKGSDDEYEEDDDEFEENTSKVNVDPSDLDDSQTLTDIGAAKSVSDEDDEDEDDEDEDEDDKKAKQKTWLIRGAIIVLVGVLAFDFLVPTEDNVVPDVPVVKKKRRKRPKRKRKPPVTAANDTKEITPKEESKPEPKMKPAVVPTVVATAVPTVAPTPTIKPTPIPSVTPPPVVDEKVIEPTRPKLKEETQVAIPPETPNKPMAIEVENTLNLGENSAQEKPSLSMDEQVDKILKKGQDKASQDAMKKNEAIDPKMEYVTPPNYKRLGRGLVYNCIGKHWACVDKFSFFQCLENSKWSTTNKKDPECVTNNVYASDEDCAVVQTHYINTGAATAFCNTQDNKAVPSPSTKVVVP